MTQGQSMTEREIRELMDRCKWYHTFEIRPGIWTPGSVRLDPRAILNECFELPPSLAGQRILEIGTYDGPYAFEMESRGAEVVAVDIQDPDHTGFNTTKKILGSKVEYIRGSVYELSERAPGPFDRVVFMGVYYHLKCPILALEQIHRVLKPGGTLLFEGESFLHYAETLGGRSIRNRLALAWMAHTEIPLTLSYPGRFKESSNWFIPNPASLRGWLEATGFEVDRLTTSFPGAKVRSMPGFRGRLDRAHEVLHTLFSRKGSQHQRAWGIARRRQTGSVIEHPLTPARPTAGA
jgi:2-polyprenyl-3-methyl-5-hydroxy-6-metoxy-1,4-benzoquinol methylase